MLNRKGLKKFIDLPPEFSHNIISDIETALDDYDVCRAYVGCRLDFYGKSAFKYADTYDSVSRDILEETLPKSFKQKLLATLHRMKIEYCGG